MSKVGKVVKIQHAQGYRRGTVFLRGTKPSYEVIMAEYEDGAIMAGRSLDCWEVVKSKDPRADFETVE